MFFTLLEILKNAKNKNLSPAFSAKGFAITLAFCSGLPTLSCTTPVRVWEKEINGKNKRITKKFYKAY